MSNTRTARQPAEEEQPQGITPFQAVQNFAMVSQCIISNQDGTPFNGAQYVTLAQSVQVLSQMIGQPA